MKKLYFLFLIINTAFSQNYLWPTNASNYISSSFCEYRPTHYHAAVDIKTWDREGYPCYAIEDGKIVRVGVSPFGYGKVMYIKLKDGHTTVYGHLQRFEPQVEKLVRKQQLKQKKYSVEIWPNIPVKRGQIVAHTGQTGIGVPHLHFEIRDDKNRPINPLQFYNIVKDNRAPHLQEIMVIPLDEKSHVNGSFRPAIIGLKYIHDGVYIPAQPIRAYGKIGLAVKGYDQINDTSNKLGFYRSDLFINDALVFESSYNRIDFSKTGQVNVEIYYPEKKRSGGRFFKLFVEPFNRLEFYDKLRNRGYIQCSEEPVSFEINIQDYFGNKSIVRGDFKVDSPQTVKLSQASVLNETAYLRLILPNDLSGLQFFTGKDREKLHPVSYFEFIDRQPTKNSETVLVKLHLNSVDDRIIKSVFDSKNGTHKESFSYITSADNASSSCTLSLFGKYALFSFNDLTDSQNLELLIGQAGQIKTYHPTITNNRSEFVLPARKVRNDSLNVRLQNGSGNMVDTTFTLHALLPGGQENFSFYHDSLRISAPAGCPYDTLLFTTKKEMVDTSAFDIPVQPFAYTLDCGDQIMDKSLKISFKNEPVFFANRWGIYELSSSGKLQFAGNYKDENYLFARTKTFSTYVIAADTLKPDIKVIQPIAGKIYHTMPKISFKIDDDLSGIGSEDNMEIYLDDTFIVPEWDPERDIVNGIADVEPASGKHTILIRLHDRAGNLNEITFPITIQ